MDSISAGFVNCIILQWEDDELIEGIEAGMIVSITLTTVALIAGTRNLHWVSRSDRVNP